MSFFSKSVSAARMINEGIKDCFEEEHLATEAGHNERRLRKLVVQGFYPDAPEKRMPLKVHHKKLHEIEAAGDEWTPFQTRNDLANGFDPGTGQRLTREQHAEVILHLNLTPEDLQDIHYWRNVDTDMAFESQEEEMEVTWRRFEREGAF